MIAFGMYYLKGKLFMPFRLLCLFVFSSSLKIVRSERFVFNAIPTESITVPGTSRNLSIKSNLTPYVVTPGTHCICVPAGSCLESVTMSPNDGAGQIDIRIVNTQPTTPAIENDPDFSCNYDLIPCCKMGPYQCGHNYPPPIGSTPAQVGQADFGEYPWQIALLTNQGVYLGSGALISSRHILTTAHKVFNKQLKSIKVRLGEWDASSSMEPIPPEDVMIARIFIHPQFNKNNLQNDVAILALATEVSLSAKSTVGTICLPEFGNSMFRAGQRCFVSGWGKNDFGSKGSYQAIQREVDVPLVSNEECQNQLRRTRLGPNFILQNASFLCAGGEIGKDSCTGDGGSPLVCESNGQKYVVGLVAWGIGCANGGTPGVYVNVASYVPWMKAVQRF